ncbi:hypothetical protein C8255_08830 [filamentous cyanobacterium CCP3]|nr:hypothetical protein C8255_08830 [filamentous cyanobacterium CCP3]
MRLKSIYINHYKNLKNFEVDFKSNGFIEIFIGKNASGKSNLFEAIIQIFHHIYEYDRTKFIPGFEYRIGFEIGKDDVEIEWLSGRFIINGKERTSVGKTPQPDNIIVYYSGHNPMVRDLIDKYELNFRKKIQSATIKESRRFIHVGPEYKELLLNLLLMQKNSNRARGHVWQKLGIEQISDKVDLFLKKPSFADGALKQLKVAKIDDFDARTHFWGAKGITKSFLDRLVACIKGAFSHRDIYSSEQDVYHLPIDIQLFQKQFEGEVISDIFRQFDNLKTLGMWGKMVLAAILKDGTSLPTTSFSDGQFQSLYIYSILEVFKDRNFIALLDEPDAFLHPEWQYSFLPQISEITAAAKKTNHILMSSHSAITLIPHVNSKVKFIDIKNFYANCYELPKNVAIDRLSSNLIKYCEQEQLLLIIKAVKIEHKPVLFTEGSTDPYIIKEAWYKLFDEDMPFIPIYAFSCSYINQLLTDKRIHSEMDGLPVFGLFDFDKAYDHWNRLNGRVVENNLLNGMVKKWADGDAYAIMLPIPQNQDIQKQVIKSWEPPESFGGESYCEIEHLFYGLEETRDFFRNEPCVGGSRIVFRSDSQKTKFAKEIVPKLKKSCFEIFLPMFEFIRFECQ